MKAENWGRSVVPISYELIRKDAVIIGGGLAGLTAARSLELSDGMSLAVLAPGTGASPYVHGFNIPLHEADSVACFINDTLKSGYYQSESQLVDILCSESLNLPSLLETFGIRFDRGEDGGYKLLRPLGASWPRVASVGNTTGVTIMKRFRAELAARENVTFYNTLRAMRLIMGDEGVANGVLAYDTKRQSWVCLKAKVVILASGGFGNIFPFSTNTDDIGGDGIAMAYEAGVPLVDLEFVQFEPSAAVYPQSLRGKGMITTLFYEGAVLRNTGGERFMLQYGPTGEQVDKDRLSQAIYREIRAGRGTAHDGVFFDATGVGRARLDKSYQLYVKRYADCGIDLAAEPVEIAPAPHTTLGGVAIAPDCSTKLSALFACGEVVGGIHGANRIGGNAGLETLVFGGRAGKAAGRYLSGMDRTPMSSQAWKTRLDELLNFVSSQEKKELLTAKRMVELRTRMEQLLSGSLNVVRCAADLQPAVAGLGEMLAGLDYTAVKDNGPELYRKLRLHNDLTTAYLLALAALERIESVGCHVRTDSVSESGERYRIQIRKGTGGAVVEKVPLS
jgi:fumarate reductase (CoM/CoB) subunit A